MTLWSLHVTSRVTIWLRVPLLLQKRLTTLKSQSVYRFWASG